jgi:hypothetical protein
VRFEAAALEAGVVMARERGRFGSVLPPYGELETVIAFNGLYDRVEVRPLFKNVDGASKSRRAGRGKSAKKKRKSGGPG